MKLMGMTLGEYASAQRLFARYKHLSTHKKGLLNRGAAVERIAHVYMSR